jgi:hypothetical protein
MTDEQKDAIVKAAKAVVADWNDRNVWRYISNYPVATELESAVRAAEQRWTVGLGGPLTGMILTHDGTRCLAMQQYGCGDKYDLTTKLMERIARLLNEEESGNP